MVPEIHSAQQDAFNSAEELSICLVAQVRQAFGMTQEQIGDIIKLHPQNVSKAENDRYTLNREQQRRLLMLREISHVPGISDVLKFMHSQYGGDDAYYVARSVHLVTL